MIDLVISSGVGPAEARRFVAQLAARLEALAEQRGIAVLDVVSAGAPDAPRSITLRLANAGALLDELGTHVLIHAARGRAARKRWFAAVTAHPATAAPGDAPAIPRDELVVTACRAGGPGGQHVNKVSSAVRVEHLPSGLAIRSAGERSQHANLAAALRRLAELLRAAAAARHAAERAAVRGVHYQLERGRPVRSYELDRTGALVERR